MSEELLQRGLDRKTPTAKIGKWDYFNIGSTSLKALKAANIIRNVDYGALEAKKVDALIVDQKDVVAVIEFKHPKEFRTVAQKEKAIQQEIEVARKLGAKLIIATDTVDTLWVNVLTGEQVIDEEGKILTTKFDASNELLHLLLEKIKTSVNEKNNQILPPELVDPTGLARSIWQDIWSVSGATPENCLYTFVELFIFKYLSDLGILKEGINFDHLMERYEYNSESPCEQALEYYANTIRPEIKKLFPENLADKTTIINGTIFVSKDQKAVEGYSTVFKKVLEKFKKHKSLEHIDYDFKSKLFESFLKESISKKNWGQFFTPMKVVRAIESIAKDEIKEGAVICDPACGVGKFLLEPIKSRLDRFYQVEGDKVISTITIEGFDKGFDKDEQKTIILAKANMLIYFSEIIKKHPNKTKEFAKIFNESFTLKTNSILGTLRDPIKEKYSLILTNPPYVTSGSSNLKEEIQKDSDLKKHYKINAIGVEGLFMEWIVRALKPNGKAFVIVPDGIFNRQNDKSLREFLRQECFIDGIISLPLNTFFTTSKKTYILCLTKKNNLAEIQIDPVFTYLVSEIGESRDVYRFDIERNDLNEATTLYNFFKGNKSSFSVINKDPRCKIVSIDEFKPAENWSVDRWWSKEEKISLGIEEEDTTIKLDDFPCFIENIADNIMSLKNILLELNEKKKIDVAFNAYSISDVFDVKSGASKYTASYVNKNSGQYPVFSSNTKQGGVLGFIDTYDYDNECIHITTNGANAGTVFYRKKQKFSLNSDARAYLLKNKNQTIDYSYATFQLQQTLNANNFNWQNKPTIERTKHLKMMFPVLPNGDFDLEYQQEIVEKYNVVSEIKAKADEYRKKLKNLTILVDNEVASFKVVNVSDIFETKKGSSKYTKTYGQSNRGAYPVYSASNNAPLTFIGTFDYDGKYLTWATNGFAGYIKVIDGRFSINGDRGLLIPKTENINIEYIRIILEPILRDLAKGRKGDNGDDEFTKVYPSMVESVMLSIPVDSDDAFDLKVQNEIAEAYRKVDEVKELLLLELQKIKLISVDI